MTKIVGILNVTPDSFSDGGDYFDPQKAIERAQELFREGADIVDIGAESTRPNAVPINSDQEWARLEPVLTALLPVYQGRLSLDSYHPETVEKALGLGAIIVNDVTGMNNPEMVKVVCRKQPLVIVSHLPGIDIQSAHANASVDSIDIVKEQLLQKADTLVSLGLPKENIILDPGIGFGKTMDLNSQLVEFARLIQDYPIMIGYSRKRFLGKHRMDIGPNLEAGKRAVDSGAAYIRVHDVKEHRRLIDSLE